MELIWLQHLLEVEKCGTLSDASKELHISQPTLSRSMQNLEAELGSVLFERTKNRIVLNEAGKLAVIHARKILNEVSSLQDVIATYEKSLHTINIGSCAPGPLWSFAPALMRQFPEKNIATEINAKIDLAEKLFDHTFQVVITNIPIESKTVISKLYCREQLFVTVPPAHPFAGHPKGIHLSDLAGETMLLYNEIGLWQERIISKLTKTNFIRQSERTAFQELVRVSALPSFTTNLTFEGNSQIENSETRVIVPLLDDDASIDFYLNALKDNYSLVSVPASFIGNQTFCKPH